MGVLWDGGGGVGVLEILGGWVSKHPPWGWDNSGSLGVVMHGMAGSDIHRLSCLSHPGLSPMLKMVCCALFFFVVCWASSGYAPQSVMLASL